MKHVIPASNALFAFKDEITFFVPLVLEHFKNMLYSYSIFFTILIPKVI